MDPIERERELYETPPEHVVELLARETFHGEIHDPCAGRLALVEGLIRGGHPRDQITAADLHDWGVQPCDVGVDFLETTEPRDNFVLNPPASMKDEFVRHALSLAKYKVAVLLPMNFEAKVSVHDILENTCLPWKARYLFTQSVPWLNTGQLGGFYHFAWFVFERDYEGEVQRERITLPKNNGTAIRKERDTVVFRPGQEKGFAGPDIETPGYQCMADIRLEETTWLWPGLIPLGELTILEGDPSTNKSALIVLLAALLSRGRKLPGLAGNGQPVKGGTLYLCGEDSPSKTVRPRLMAAKADLGQIVISEKYGAIPGDLKAIEQTCAEKDIRLLVADTMECAFGVNVMNNQKLRNKVLGPLRQFAERLDMAVIMIRHFTKANGPTLIRGTGPIGITGAARNQLQMHLNPNDPETMRVLAHAKCNVGPKASSQLFEVTSAPVDGVSNPVPLLVHRGTSQFSADDLNGVGQEKGSPKLKAVKELLQAILKDGPVEYNEVIRRGTRRIEVGRRTIEKAKAELRIETKRVGSGRNGTHKVYWSLPSRKEAGPTVHSPHLGKCGE